MIATFAKKIVAFEPHQFQKSYNLSFIMCCVRNFSAIFGVDTMRSSRDRASAVEGLPDGVLADNDMVLWRAIFCSTWESELVSSWWLADLQLCCWQIVADGGCMANGLRSCLGKYWWDEASDG
jgi:hypothetical protein